jgi:hypothetical protein
VRIEYVYRVGGIEYHGKRYRYGEGSSSDSAWAQTAVAARPVGAEIPVFYNPGDPADALLSPGVDGGDLMLLLFLTPFNAVMLGLWSVGSSALRHWIRPRPAGGLRLRTTRWQTRVSLEEFGPLMAGLVAVGGSAFASVFVIAFGFGGFHPRLPVVGTVWGIVLGLGLIAVLWQWLRLRSGRLDMVIDESAGWMEVPAEGGNRQPRRIPFTAVQRVDVETVSERTSGRRNTVTYHPVLHLRTGHGDSIRVGKFHLETRAQGFADWLRQKVATRGV